MKNILTGMRVIEGSAFVAIPLAGMSLAQMGAEVIRFDRLEGGLDAARMPYAPSGKSLFWAGLNKGKKSIAVDFKNPKGRELITQLIQMPAENSGILLTNLMVKGWIDHEVLREVRKDLISITLTGDRHGLPQVDYTVGPALGIPHFTGPEGSSDPIASAIPTWDLLAGQLCVTTLLAAERYRFISGKGQKIEISLKDVAAATLGHLGLLSDAVLNSEERQKAGNSLYGAYGQDFICADGERVMVIGLTLRQWQGIVQITETADKMAELEKTHNIDLSDESVRWKYRHEITQILEPWFKKRIVSDFSDIFNSAKLTWSRFRSLKEAMQFDDDLSLKNPLFQNVNQPGIGQHLVPTHPAKFSEFDRKSAEKAPILGAHTEEILLEVMKLSEAEVASLFDNRIVAGPNHNV